MERDQKQKNVISDLCKLGIDQSEAQAAVKNCLGAMAKKGVFWGTGVGVVAFLVTKNAVGGLTSFVAGTMFGMDQANESDSCGPSGWGEDAKETLRKSTRQWLKNGRQVKDLLP